jgi:hypothetical protein
MKMTWLLSSRYDSLRTTAEVAALAPSGWAPSNLALVIFGAPVLESGVPSPPLQDRCGAAPGGGPSAAAAVYSRVAQSLLG